MEILPSALKHGITEREIRHVVDHIVSVGEDDNGRVLIVGFDPQGQTVEVFVQDWEVIFHAMRPPTLPTLRALRLIE